MLLTNKPGSRIQAAIHMPKEAWPILSAGHRFFEFWEWVPGNRFGEHQILNHIQPTLKPFNFGNVRLRFTQGVCDLLLRENDIQSRVL